MFTGLDSAQVNTRRGWPAIVSFTLQAAAVAAALTIPMLYPNSLPDPFSRVHIFAPVMGPEPENPPTDQRPTTGTGAFAGPARPIFVTPGGPIRPHDDTNATGPIGPPNINPYLGPSSPIAGPPIGAAPPPEVHVLAARPPIISRPMQGYLLRRIEPVYPRIAITAGVQGSVLIKAVISTDGRIEQAKVVEGSPFLAKAALDAVQQWRYRPFLLNDRPVEVETEITVNFVLNR